MEHKSHKSKKRKGGDTLNAGSFKKALVSPLPHVGGPAGVFGNGDGLAELDLLGGIQSADDDSASSDEENHAQAAKSSPPKRILAQASFVHTAASSTSGEPSKSSMATMADLLASAGDNNERHNTSSVSDDVIKMQQQLQQQIPLDPETNTRLREQIMESMTGIPTMQMIIEQNLASNSTTNANTNNSAIADTHSSVPDASTMLMSLSHDPSILATMKPAEHTEPTSSSSKSSKKKSKSKNTTTATASASSKPKISAVPQRSLEDQLAADMGSDNPLHTKWLMATALKEKGIAYRTGTFSSHEDELIRQTISDYVSRHNMAEDAINRWFENGNGRGRFEKNDLKALWVEIAVRLQTRPLLNIYLHVRRMFHPQNNVGTWSKEDDKKLIELYAKHKGQWTTIGTELGRMADSCRDRYRNHLKDQSTMVTGPWQPHEDEKLLSIMQDLALAQGKASILDSNPMWTLISERMEGTRTRHQCRHRYSQTLQPRLERGEWTGPSSAAAAAAAAVAANASTAAEAVKQHQHTIQLQNDLGLGLVQNHDQSKNSADQDVLILAAALHGAMPNSDNNSNSDSMMWTQAMTTNMGQGDGHPSSGDITLGAGEGNFNDHFTASIAAAGIPIPTMVPRAPKGPIRRRGGLQQQLDVLHMILESGVTDHTEIQWTDIAQKLRNKVQESNAIQLAKIIQTQDQLHSKKNHLEDGDSTAVAAAAAAAAMAAAVSAAQAEAVASLQRVPASNQIARTFMSSRCKTDGYRQMTLKQVVGLMIQDVERRIQHRRGGSSSALANNSGDKNESGEDDSARTSSRPAVMIQQQEINDAAQQAAIAALSAHFPELQQQEDMALGHHHHHASSSSTALSSAPTDADSSTRETSTSSPGQQKHSQKQHKQELLQQQHDRALAEKMLNVAFTNSDLAGSRPLLGGSASSGSRRSQSKATRRVLSALKSSEFVSDSSESSSSGSSSSSDESE
ncbi:RNA polymerase I enhancer binding protein [Podila verticillata]|nr:RNA polymerase I enhancer binding protein [Podila verticillata]